MKMEGAPRKTAEECLPAEMWSAVFGYLDKEEDLLKCYNTSTFARNILQPKVFAQALAVVERVVAGTSSKLTQKDILSCRLVSRDWQKMTDHYLQSRGSRLDLSCYRPVALGNQHSFNDQLIPGPNRFGAIILRRSNLEEARSLVEEIISNTRVKKSANVLIGRYLIIVGHRGCIYSSEDARDPEKQRFYDIVSRLLTACGQHIWYLSVCDSISDGLPQLLLNTYWKWLQQVPHLKMLTCQITVGAMAPDTGLEAQKELLARLPKESFPRLPQLVTLQCNGVPDMVLQSALQVNPQIKKVEVVPFRYDADMSMAISQWWCTPITEFCFIRCKGEELKQLTETGWPLEKLTIRFDLELGPQQWDTEYYLEQLNNFGKTLKFLKLEFPSRFSDVEEPDWDLQLPHLEELHLDVTHHAQLDYIRPCKSLKKLKLSVAHDEGEVEPHVIFPEDATPMSDLYVSHIWKLIPSLREVQVKMFKCETMTFVNFNYTQSELSELII